jgi:hypothetical protein
MINQQGEAFVENFLFYFANFVIPIVCIGISLFDTPFRFISLFVICYFCNWTRFGWSFS